MFIIVVQKLMMVTLPTSGGKVDREKQKGLKDI